MRVVEIYLYQKLSETNITIFDSLKKNFKKHKNAVIFTILVSQNLLISSEIWVIQIAK